MSEPEYEEPQYETHEVYEQRRRAVAEKIREVPEQFNMMSFINGGGSDPDPMCGTTLCIAGWAAVHVPGVSVTRTKWGEPRFGPATLGLNGKVEEVAADWLGLDPDEAHHLFYGHFSPAAEAGRLDEITPDEAIAALMAAPYVCDPAPVEIGQTA